jgi:hypothetical protein
MSEPIYFFNGDILLHKKGNYYKVIEASAKHSETLEEVVVYQSLRTKEIWVRPREMFTKDRFEVAIRVEWLNE